MKLFWICNLLDPRTNENRAHVSPYEVSNSSSLACVFPAWVAQVSMLSFQSVCASPLYELLRFFPQLLHLCQDIFFGVHLLILFPTQSLILHRLVFKIKQDLALLRWYGWSFRTVSLKITSPLHYQWYSLHMSASHPLLNPFTHYCDYKYPKTFLSLCHYYNRD